MNHCLVNALELAPQPWRNGGGSTRELLAWPDAQSWQVRISLADIVQDGAFSAFPGVQRWFGVVQGAGVALQFADRHATQTLADGALQFDGATAPFCHLLNGGTRDLNLMLRGGSAANGCMQPVADGAAWQSSLPLRALLTTVAGLWCDDLHERHLAAYDFLWTAHAAPSAWRFTCDAPASTPLAGAWWLGAQVHKDTL